MKSLKVLLSILLVIQLSACTSSEPIKAPKYDKDNDPRIGEKVTQVCFTSSISGWSEVDNDRSALIVHFGNKESYKVDLVGACQADWAMMSIALVSRTNSSCLSIGDKLFTDAQTNRHASCRITGIHEWDVNPGDSEENGLDKKTN